MAAIVSEFFLISGVDMVPPENLGEMIPWLLQVIVAVVLVLAVFKMIAEIAKLFFNWRWFK